MPKRVYEKKDVLPILEEIFKQYGYDGASLAIISRKTGLGKGSLYHFFPGGKEQMAAEVLAETERWFEENLIIPLKSIEDPRAGIELMFETLASYYRAGRYISFPSVLALSKTNDIFSDQISKHFNRLLRGLTRQLMRTGRSTSASWNLAEDIIGMIEGSLVITHALKDPRVYGRMAKRIKKIALST